MKRRAVPAWEQRRRDLRRRAHKPGWWRARNLATSWAEGIGDYLVHWAKEAGTFSLPPTEARQGKRLEFTCPPEAAARPLHG